MTIIRPNSISGINSITAKNTDQMKLYDSNGAWSHVRAGIITASSFSGSITGTTGNFGGDVTISGDLGVGGTITYEDVARVDATGISTFREGFKLGPLAGIALTAYKDGSIRSTGIITASSFVGSLAASNLTGALPAISGANLTGITAVGGATGVDFNDGVKARWGTDDDLELFHSGSAATLKNTVGNLNITNTGNNTIVNSDNITFQSGDQGETIARFLDDGACELWFDNTKKIETTSSGVTVTGDVTSGGIKLNDDNLIQIGTGGDLVLRHNGSHSYISNGTGQLQIQGNGDDVVITAADDVLIKTQSNHHAIECKGDGPVDIYYDGVKKFETSSTGISLSGSVSFSANNTYNVGTNTVKPNAVFSNYWVHRYGQSGNLSWNQSEGIFIWGGLHFFHDYVTLSTSNFSHGICGNRTYNLLRMRNSGSGAAIYAENGAISSGSDYRMKENVAPITGGIDAVKKLKPCTYNIRKSFNEHDAGGTHQGFIAHEVQEAIPNIVNIVNGNKDDMEEVLYMNEDTNIPAGKKPGDGTGVFTGKPDMQGIDYGHMTPILAAALKELIAEVETLKTEVAALKSS